MAQTMIRKQLYIDPEHDQILKRLAKERGKSEAEIVREAIDDYQRRLIREREIEWLRERQAQVKASSPPQPRGWTREQIYEERMKRYARHTD